MRGYVAYCIIHPLMLLPAPLFHYKSRNKRRHNLHRYAPKGVYLILQHVLLYLHPVRVRLLQLHRPS